MLKTYVQNNAIIDKNMYELLLFIMAHVCEKNITSELLR